MILGVLCLHDDADIVESCFRWHLNNGVDKLCIMFHNVTDETKEAIAPFRDEIAVALYSTEKKYNQHVWMDELRRTARNKLNLTQDDWFVHFDADEFWSNLELLKAVPNTAQAVSTNTWVNYLPYSTDEHNFKDVKDYVFSSFMHYGSNLSKVALRATSSLVTTTGNHFAVHCLPRKGNGYFIQPTPGLVVCEDILIDHFPLRTFKQFSKKVEAAKRVVLDPDEKTSWHWKEWATQKNPMHWYNLVVQGDPEKVKPLEDSMKQRLLKLGV